MTSLEPSQTARQLQHLAAQFDAVARTARNLDARARGALGGSATGADRAMVSGLLQISSSARDAQQSLSAAAGALGKVR